MSDRNEIGDEELLYRKVSVNSGWYDPQKNELKPEALKPRKDDISGISFDRAKSESHSVFRSMEEVAKGPSPNGYYVAVFRASELRAHGLTIRADPLPENTGHALLVDITYHNRKEALTQEIMVLMAHKLVQSVEGPFA